MKAILFFYVIIYLLLTCSKLEPRQPHKPLYILPSGCYRYPGIPDDTAKVAIMRERAERTHQWHELTCFQHSRPQVFHKECVTQEQAAVSPHRGGGRTAPDNTAADRKAHAVRRYIGRMHRRQSVSPSPRSRE